MDSEPIYRLRVAEVYRALETSPEGISSAEAESRRALYGKNALSEPTPEPTWRRLAAFATHPMALILWCTSLIAFFVSDPTLGVIIWIVIGVNAALSFWREHRAEQAMAALRKLLPTYARLMRDGTEVMIPADEVVPGDVLVLAEGDNIPADARVVEEYGLRTNNATLTGDAVPARKASDASLREGISELERPNLVFAGTSIVSGTGRAVVYATGMMTQFGRIARLTQTVQELPSNLQKELNRITRVISLVALGLGVLVYWVGTTDIRMAHSEAFLLALGILVAAVPEGLPATLTLALAMAVQRLAQRGVLVKKLAITETLGNVSIICTDKSGTLTQNQMTVREVWVARRKLSVSGAGYEPAGEFSPSLVGDPSEEDLKFLLTGAILCNNSRLSPPSTNHPQWTSLGDQTEVALRVAALKGGLDPAALETELPRIHELPFDARRKRMSTIHRNTNGEIAFVKGGPREVLQLCTSIRIDGETRPLDASLRAEILAVNDEFARGALRVLGLAYRQLPLPGEQGDPYAIRGGLYTVEKIERELTFLGLMAMMDPPRPEIARAVEVFRQAGVRLVMITGDYGLTAESFARRVGMLASATPTILTGAELDELEDIHLQNLLDKEVIFARMAPEHKLRLVAAYQAQGEVVAVAGDGVNDAPALRKADVGIAMGISGTDVAKEAADIILTNDNFASIVNAIEEGRAIYDNIRKFITYIFSSNVPEILPFILKALSFPIPLALTVRQILAIDLGTDLLPALALGTEKPEPDVMQRPPRRPNQPLLDRNLLMRAFLWLGMIEGLLCFSGFFLVYYLGGYLSPFLSRGQPLPDRGFIYVLATTIFHAGVVLAQAGNAFACRTERLRGRRLGWLSNRFLLAGVGAELLIILALIYIPWLNKIFEHAPLPLPFWAWLVFYPIVLYGADWIRKSIVRWLSSGRNFLPQLNGGR